MMKLKKIKGNWVVSDGKKTIHEYSGMTIKQIVDNVEPTWYDVETGNIKHGYLITIKRWKENVECGGFIDYDGYGVEAKYKEETDEFMIDRNSMAMWDDHSCIYPSEADLIDESVKYIVWYNR